MAHSHRQPLARPGGSNVRGAVSKSGGNAQGGARREPAPGGVRRRRRRGVDVEAPQVFPYHFLVLADLGFEIDFG